MEIFVYSRPAIERVAPHDEPHVIISITSHERDVAQLPASPSCRGVLRLSFADEDDDGPHAFNLSHASHIWSFLAMHAEVARVLVHCDAGMSRSPGVAVAILEARGLDTDELYRRYIPNARVVRMMREARAAP